MEGLFQHPAKDATGQGAYQPPSPSARRAAEIDGFDGAGTCYRLIDSAEETPIP